MDKIQDEIIDEFAVFDDWLDKYDYLIGLSETLPAIAPEHRTERYLIEGCQSRVWVDAKLEGGRVYYAADSDAIITKGIIALLIRVLNGRTPQEVLDKVQRWSSLGREDFEERIGECSWEVALVIPYSAFFMHNVTSLGGKTIRANFYKCGDKLQTPHFLSWSPIDLEKPNFHCPEFFGELHFE